MKIRSSSSAFKKALTSFENAVNVFPKVVREHDNYELWQPRLNTDGDTGKKLTSKDLKLYKGKVEVKNLMYL